MAKLFGVFHRSAKRTDAQIKSKILSPATATLGMPDIYMKGGAKGSNPFIISRGSFGDIFNTSGEVKNYKPGP